MDLTYGLRFFVTESGSKEEAKVIEYLRENNIDYRVCPQGIGSMRIDGKDADLSVIWYLATTSDQKALVRLTSGTELF